MDQTLARRQKTNGRATELFFMKAKYITENTTRLKIDPMLFEIFNNGLKDQID